MDISIFGLGYVGCISLGCLAKNGHSVIGVDVNQSKVDLINRGKPTVIEKDIDNIIAEAFANKKIKATQDYKFAVETSEVAIICVGTPSSKTGQLDLSHLYNVAAQIGEALNTKEEFLSVFIRSTVPPGTNQKVTEIISEHSNKQKNEHFAVVSNPEFLREGSAVKDYYHPPYTVLGTDSPVGIEIGRQLYEELGAPIFDMKIEEAELIKYLNNSFHALKITFANEVGVICKKLGIDSHRVMDVFTKDDKLNISPAYLKPGFAFGGSCLPKDLKALATFAHDFYLNTPVLNSIDQSNKNHIEYFLETVYQTGKKKVGVLGLSFKPGTDDLRYSPMVTVVERLLGKGYEIRIFDQNVELSRLTGGNKSFIEEKLPHLGRLLSTKTGEVIDKSDIIIIANKEDIFNDLEIPEDKIIFDLTRIEKFEGHPNYHGICW